MNMRCQSDWIKHVHGILCLECISQYYFNLPTRSRSSSCAQSDCTDRAGDGWHAEYLRNFCAGLKIKVFDLIKRTLERESL